MNTASDGRLILNEFLPYRLSVITNRISATIAAVYERRFNMTIPEWRVIAIVAEREGLSAAEVAQRAAMDKVAVSRAVNSLLKAGRLDRKFSRADRRRSELSLTEAGRAIYAEVVPLAMEYEATLKGRLSSDDQATLNRLLEVLSEAQEAIETRQGH